MEKQLFTYKFGAVQSGNWQWAIGANSNIGKVPLCVATINFHGANAAGYDSEKLAHIFAAAPDMLAALATISGKISSYHDADNDDAQMHIIADIEATLSAAIAKAKGESI